MSIPLNKLPCPPPSSPPALVRSTYYNPPENSTLIRLLQATRLNLIHTFFQTTVFINDASRPCSPRDTIPLLQLKREYIISLDSYWMNLSNSFSSQDNSLAQKRSTQSLQHVSLLKMKASISVSRVPNRRIYPLINFLGTLLS